MIKLYFLPALVFFSFSALSQDNGFPFGKFSYRDLNMQVYEKDTAAEAVFLDEFAEAYMDDGNDFNLLFRYHAKIKILKKSGVRYGDIEVPLGKDKDGRAETLRSVKASSFTLENGSMKETQLENKNLFTENQKYVDLKKFAIPNVQVGSVIEYQYIIESPFIFNFRNWEFHAFIPKMRSEYWAKIPANYIYNMTLKGFFKLDKNDSEIIRDCYTPNGQNADCVLYKFAMNDVPAFVDEEYMTARSNFVSGINFELSEVKHWDGRVQKFTKEWKDVDLELKRAQDFGLQIKRGKDILDEHISSVIAGEHDPLLKAKKIYDFIKGWYQWDEKNSKYSELGIKKAFDQKKGNVGDINLSLIAALRYADLNVEPVILSTRQNGFPIEIHPVLSDFNYVIAKINIGDKVYLADATDDFHPFGLLPERCLNGKGRVLGESDSYWIDLKPADRAKQISMATLKLSDDGLLTGSLKTTFMGYEAVSQRKKIHTFSDQKEYIKDLERKLPGFEIKDFELENVDDVDKPLVQTLKIEFTAFDKANASNFLFNPFFLKKWDENPFKSNERFYPVDFGRALEYITVFNLEYPSGFEIANSPEKTGLALPNGGGRFLFDVQNQGNKLSLNQSLTITRAMYSSTEYHYLKELFTRMIQIQNGELLFKKKT